MRIRQRLAAIRHWLAARGCVLCAGPVARGHDFCDGCEHSLPAIGPCCAVCATPLPGTNTEMPICGQCQQRSPRYDRVRAPFRYAAPIDRLIQGGKYNARFDWLDILGRRLARHVHVHQIDAIAPVPLHRSRLRTRGYNQSLELARPLARRLGLPLYRGIERVRATPPQTGMSRAQRRRNMNNAFEANAAVAGLRVAIIDDVMTSGATVEAVARCLRESGATSVEVWVVARA